MNNNQVLVIGAGYAGINTAQTWADRGYHVKVVETEEEILPSVSDKNHKGTSASGDCAQRPLFLYTLHYISNFLTHDKIVGQSTASISMYFNKKGTLFEMMKNNMEYTTTRYHITKYPDDVKDINQMIKTIKESRSRSDYFIKKIFHTWIIQ